jgi:hypothetical protein
MPRQRLTTTPPKVTAHFLRTRAMSTHPSAQPQFPSRNALARLGLTLRAGLLYFAAVFAVGFVLGTVRVLWAVPRFGPRGAELMEMPLMLVAIVLAALWGVRWLAVSPRQWVRLSMGLVALGCLLLTEFTVVLQLQGLSIAEYVANRDPVSGTAYILMLVLFALMPWLLARRAEPL